jgi:hypothetical protein
MNLTALRTILTASAVAAVAVTVLGTGATSGSAAGYQQTGVSQATKEWKAKPTTVVMATKEWKVATSVLTPGTKEW